MRTGWQEACRNGNNRRRARRGRLPVLGAVLLAALTAVAGLPVAGVAASAQPQQTEVRLTASDVDAAGATLTIANHTAVWHYMQTAPAGGTCSAAVPADTAAAELTGLTPGTAYTFAAYSDSTCTTLLATALPFTTHTQLAVLSKTAATLTASAVTRTAATLTIADQTGNWYHQKTGASASCSSAISSASASLTSLTAGTSYVWKAYSDSACADANEIAAAAFTTPAAATLTPSDVTATAATLTIANHTGTWYHKRTSPSGEPAPSCEAAGDPLAGLTGLTPGIAYLWKAYSDSGCTEANEIAAAAFTTPQAPAMRTFTANNWHVAQTVTVSAGHDSDIDDDTAAITHTAASADANFNGKSLGTVTVAIADDDVSLTAESIGTTSATLRIHNHTGIWYHKQAGEPYDSSDPPRLVKPCLGPIKAGQATVNVTGLTADTEYVWEAYSDPNCETELTNESTEVLFRTAQNVSFSPSPGTGGGGGGGASSAKAVRLSGATRYSTATDAASRFVSLVEDASAAAGSRRQVDTVIVASGEAFPDALAASALARTLRAPVVLTPKKQLDSAVKSFVTANRISKVVIVGGPAAVSDDVQDALEGISGVTSVTRHAGADRYATAALIAKAAGAPGLLCGSSTPTVIVTTGENFPDALVAGPLAYRGKHPVVLTATDSLPDATADYLRASGAKQAVIVGGLKAVSSDVVDAIKALGLSTTRVSGSDRADTSVQFARRFSAISGPSCFRRDTIGLATGWAFPDALSAAALLGHYGAPLLLTHPDSVPQALLDYAASGRLKPDFDQPPIVTIGGRKAVPSNHPTKLLAALPR